MRNSWQIPEGTSGGIPEAATAEGVLKEIREGNPERSYEGISE